MDDGKLNNRVYPPASTPVAQQNDNVSFINVLDNENTGAFENARSLGENPVFFPLDQSSTTPHWSQMHGNYQNYSYASLDTGNNTMVDLNQPPSFQYPTNTGNIPNPYRQNYPLFQRENRVNASENCMNVQPQFSNFHNPGLYRNSSLNRGNAHEVIDLTLGDDNGAGENNPYGPGGGKNVLYKSQDTEVTSSFNQNQINAAQFGSSRRVDGGFLSIGNGYRLTDVLNNDSQNRWMDKLAARSSTNPAPHFGGFSGFRNNMGGLPSPQNNMGGLPSPQNNMGGLLSSQNNVGGLANSQNNMGGLPSFQNNTGGLPNFQNNIVGLPNSQNNLDGLPNSQNNLGVFPSVRNKMGGLNNSVNDAGTMSSAGYLPNTRTSHDVQRLQANREHGFPKPSNSNRGYMPNVDTRYVNLDPYDVLRDRLHAPSGIFSNSSTEFSRPGTYLTTEASPAQKLYQESLENNLARSLSSARHMGSSFGRGYSGQVPNPRNSEAQAGNDASRLLMRRSNQLAGRMIPSPENYGDLQVPNPYGNPSFKRSIIYPDPSSHRVQRRKTMPQYPNPPYGSFRPQTPPPSSVHVPVSRGGSGGALKLSGHKCMICKRDLAFSPEGPIQQPSVPPGVAVLPCQHTFHDHCLQLITPEDQKTNPPCIPCAMGEK